MYDFKNVTNFTKSFYFGAVMKMHELGVDIQNH
jgi:hypothetical protein